MGKKTYYYAVQRGRNTGVYDSWDKCKNEVNGYSKPVFRKFETYEEAQAFSNSGSSNSSSSNRSYYNNNNNYNSYTSTGSSSSGYNKRSRDDSDDYGYSASSHVERPRAKVMKPSAAVASKYDSKRDGQAKVVYTDGASSNNGKTNARAGYGVYWGDNDSRNASVRLNGDRQTNQRAETMAIIHAVEQDLDSNETLEIRTDSQYVINALTDWSVKWRENDWKSNNKEVQNRDLFEKAISTIEKRKGKVTFTHVPGHQGIKGNEEADRLAVHGATLPSKK